jgi:hypothetical protein
MKAQKPAEGILKRNDWGDTKVYKVSCDCGSSDHDHNVWVEADDTGIAVTTYTQVTSKFWELDRWTTIWKLLTLGYVEYESSTIMNKQQALNYAETLKTAVNEVVEFERQRKINAKVISRINKRLAKDAERIRNEQG